jgi:6-pyruvoyl-tetrahydropterin synthase
MFELSKQFWFDAAHTLNRSIDAESSRRIHGHSYRAEVTVRGIKPELLAEFEHQGTFGSTPRFGQ